ncbi:2-oxoacid:ferredoxin oxidoreductase subunit beta [bacterium]|nr:2-oxoacid:ferredoxin oxidoreductase subunit beta [bacterium]
MSQNTPLTKKDFTNDQLVRWCPGCGDYAILSAIQSAMPRLNRKKEDFAFVSGIGCAARFPYYMGTYGFHTIHGRAPAIATGLKLCNPDLSVWMITGDGDSLAIGGNHFIHMLRRNIDINVLLFNNQIYGLTKGQYSPTSNQGHVTKSTPMGAPEKPFWPGELTIGAGASFFARTIDTNPKLMTEVFLQSAQHKGTSMIEILQNCVIFNDNAWISVTERPTAADTQLHLEDGKPMIFGKEKNKGIRLNGFKLEVVTIGEDGVSEADLLVHDAKEEDATIHMMLAKMKTPEFPMALGIIRATPSRTYDEIIEEQSAMAKEKSKITTVDELLNTGQTWEIL